MATIFRAPLYSWSPTRFDCPQTRYLISAGLSLSTAVALPSVGQQELGPPKRPFDAVHARSWELNNDPPLSLAVVVPGQSAGLWELPQRRDSPLTRDRQRVNDLGRQLFVRLPFSRTDWPLAKRVDSPQARDWRRTNDLQRQLAVSLPTGRAVGFDGLPQRVYRPASYAPESPPINMVVLARTVFRLTLESFRARAVDSVQARDVAPLNLLPLTPPSPPATVTSSGARRLIMSIRQAIAREEFERTVLAAYAKVSGALSIPAPPKVQEAIRASIIEMIAKLPQIVAALQGGYRMADIMRVVDRAGSIPTEIDAVEVPPEMQAPLREIREVEIAGWVAREQLDYSEVALAKFAKDEATAKRLEEATLKKLGPDLHASSARAFRVQQKRDAELKRQLAAQRAKIAKAQREQVQLRTYRAEIKALLADYAVRQRLLQANLVKLEMAYQSHRIGDQRRRIEQARAEIDKAANVIAGLDDDDDEATTLLN